MLAALVWWEGADVEISVLRAVLRDVTLNIPRGRVTALVGHSGAGKSTVAALVSRFYEPSSGDILLGGSSVKGFTRGEWARAVALVSQEPVLFSGVEHDEDFLQA